eukprot:840357_1
MSYLLLCLIQEIMIIERSGLFVMVLVGMYHVARLADCPGCRLRPLCTREPIVWQLQREEDLAYYIHQITSLHSSYYLAERSALFVMVLVGMYHVARLADCPGCRLRPLCTREPIVWQLQREEDLAYYIHQITSLHSSYYLAERSALFVMVLVGMYHVARLADCPGCQLRPLCTREPIVWQLQREEDLAYYIDQIRHCANSYQHSSDLMINSYVLVLFSSPMNLSYSLKPSSRCYRVGHITEALAFSLHTVLYYMEVRYAKMMIRKLALV